MKCPHCRLENPPSAQVCDCGYDFEQKKLRQAHGQAGRSDTTKAHKTVQNSAIAGFVFVLFYGLFALLGFGFYRWVSALIAVLFLSGSILALTRQYSGARVCMLIGGVLALPLGVFMIGAGNRIREAGHDLERGPTSG